MEVVLRFKNKIKCLQLGPGALLPCTMQSLLSFTEENINIYEGNSMKILNYENIYCIIGPIYKDW
jgi:hypothetical protein